MQTAARASQVPVVRNIFDTFDYTVVGNRVHVNGVRLGNVESMLRRGDLTDFVRATNSNVRVRPRDETAFRKTLTTVPDPNIRALENSIQVQRNRHPGLNINATDRDALDAALTPQSRSTLENAARKLRVVAGTTGVVVGVFAVIVLGVDFYKSLLIATANRNGCFLARRTTRGITSCRILNRSCGARTDQTVNSCSTGEQQRDTLLYNTALFLMTAANDALLSVSVGNALLERDLREDDVGTILNDATKLDQASKLYYANPIEIPSVCMDMPTAVETVKPFCRACNPSADLNSSAYVSTELLDDAFSPHCITDGSILDTLVDIGIGIGVDLVGGLNNASGDISGNLKGVGIIFLIIFLIAIVITIFSKFGGGKSKQQYPPPY
jgi:hypothetical protein